MSFAPLRVTIHLDGTGIYYDPAEPIHLDSLLAALLVHGDPPARDEEPDEIPIPCAKWRHGDVWGWRCSALQPDGPAADGLVHWRKRFREGRADLIPQASPNLEHHTYRAWNTPLPLLLCHALVGYAVGDRRAVREALKDLRYVGKKRAHGHGRVRGVDVERIEEDWGCVRDGIAQRWLPDETGGRLVRPRPPYWSSVGRVLVCEVGHAAPGWAITA
jgi:hypothetical protein